MKLRLIRKKKTGAEVVHDANDVIRSGDIPSTQYLIEEDLGQVLCRGKHFSFKLFKQDEPWWTTRW